MRSAMIVVLALATAGCAPASKGLEINSVRLPAARAVGPDRYTRAIFECEAPLFSARQGGVIHVTFDNLERKASVRSRLGYLPGSWSDASEYREQATRSGYRYVSPENPKRYLVGRDDRLTYHSPNQYRCVLSAVGPSGGRYDDRPPR